MNFILYFTIPSFIKALRPKSTVYFTPYSQTKRPDLTEGFVLLTSDAGLEGGTVRVLQLKIKVTSSEEVAIDVASKAAANLAQFLTNKGIDPQIGVLLTAGLQDAIKYWGHVIEYSLEELNAILEKAKDVALKTE